MQLPSGEKTTCFGCFPHGTVRSFVRIGKSFGFALSPETKDTAHNKTESEKIVRVFMPAICPALTRGI